MSNTTIKTVALLLLLAILPAWAVAGEADPDDPTEVILFHLTRRCSNCLAVERVAWEFVQECKKTYGSKGRVLFLSIDSETTPGKELRRKLGVSAQALVVVHGADRWDITEKAFLYAPKRPDKLREVLVPLVERYIH